MQEFALVQEAEALDALVEPLEDEGDGERFLGALLAGQLHLEAIRRAVVHDDVGGLEVAGGERVNDSYQVGVL